MVSPIRLSLALMLAMAAPSLWAQTAPPHVLPDGSVPPALAAARMHMLEAPENMLTFHNMDQLFQTRVVARSGPVAPLARTDTALPPATIRGKAMSEDAWEDLTYTSALLVMRDGKVLHESYRNNTDADTHFISFSMAKTFTSMLVGIAVGQGAIRSIDDPAVAYVPELKGSGYDGVTIAQLLTMTSGVKWNEDYTDPKSDVARMFLEPVPAGEDPTVFYMKTLPREAPAGSKWVYKTGETNLIGVLVSSATGKTLSSYLSEKIWKPFGMDQDAVWMLGPTGHEISGCCVSASLRDYARFGLFILGGGVAGGEKVLPDDWLAAATTKQAAIDQPGRGYGYQWWTNDDGSFAAQGIFGQGIFIDPKRRLVIASNGNWPTATDPEGVGAAREAFYKAVQAAVDRESSR